MSAGKAGDITGSLIDAVRQMVADGDLQPGGRMPSERELATRFNVDRSSVRQALKALSVMGVIRQQVRSGTHLTEDASTILDVPVEFLLLGDGITFAELFEARRIFEPELAARAASHHTVHEVAQLEKSLAGMKQHVTAGSLLQVAECDRTFHHLIWEMAGNRICLRMLAPLHRIMTNSFAITWSIGDYRQAIASHAGILDAIRAGDPFAAQTFMDEHLDLAEGILKKGELLI